LKRYAVLVLFGSVVLGILAWDDFSRFLSPQPVAKPAVRVVRILPGMSLHSIAHLLEQEGLIQDGKKFVFLAWWQRVGKRIQWGDFELYTGMAPGTILDYLKTGRTILKRVTFPEGFTLSQIARRLAEENLVDEKSFLQAGQVPDFLQELGLEGDSLEGYLFPDTYVFHRGMSSRAIQKRMVDRFKEIWSELEKKEKCPDAREIRSLVTLASIIEKETGLSEEKPLIASVFYNRLKKGMALQSDPTVIYGIKHFDGDLTKKHLLTPTPYNTYLKVGLPPGPVANPGKDSLQAALRPASSDYLYFVSKNDGSHFFSRTLKEHNRAVARFQPSGKSHSPSKTGKNKI
jgi:peptidoglycan lytic transglycosylase G